MSDLGVPVPPQRPSRPPAPLVVAASLVAVEAILLVLVGVAEVAAIAGNRLVMGVTTALFFVAYGAGLGYCAWSVNRLRSWARSPILLAQLIQLGVAWSFRGAPWTWVALALAVVAVVVIIGIFHPASIKALAEEHPAES